MRPYDARRRWFGTEEPRESIVARMHDVGIGDPHLLNVQSACTLDLCCVMLRSHCVPRSD
jgi:hypothetical protein